MNSTKGTLWPFEGGAGLRVAQVVGGASLCHLPSHRHERQSYLVCSPLELKASLSEGTSRTQSISGALIEHSDRSLGEERSIPGLCPGCNCNATHLQQPIHVLLGCSRLERNKLWFSTAPKFMFHHSVSCRILVCCEIVQSTKKNQGSDAWQVAHRAMIAP